MEMLVGQDHECTTQRQQCVHGGVVQHAEWTLAEGGIAGGQLADANQREGAGHYR